MPYDLLTYFEKRVSGAKKEKPPGAPFLTISRQTGCNGNELAFLLIKALRQKKSEWKYINKEVLEESANKLKLDQSKIEYVFDTKEKTHVDEILSALSNRYYKSDRKVRKTITEVLRHDAREGNIIIVGRAGVATTQDLPGGLHIRLTAPYEWRVNALKRRKAFENTDVAAFIKSHDAKKKKLIEDFSGKKISEIQFDLNFNCATFSKAQIVELILEAMKMKKMIRRSS
jgi:cytidylate kinase